jgi:tetratricopeptide (TPR) repeat protein
MKQLHYAFYNTFSAIIFAYLLLGTPARLAAQDNATECPETENKKAQELYKKANDMQKYKKEERMAFLKQALDLDEDYLAANFMYAEEMIKTEVYENSPFAPACVYFKKVIDLCPKYHSDPYYFIGFSYYEQEKYADAITWLQKFLDFKDDNDKKYSKKYDDYLYEAKEMIKYAKFYQDIMQHPVPFDPYPVPGLCTEHDEYLPCISPDNQFAFFTRKLPFIAIQQYEPVFWFGR